MTEAYQFTVGARVVVRNTVTNGGNPKPYDKFPQYEWNWGTVNEIISSTSVKIIMDNDANYGMPWVVTSSSQTIYRNSYRLIGEITTHTNGNVYDTYRVDDPWRMVRITVSGIYQDTILTNGTDVSLGRHIPLWATQANLSHLVRTAGANKVFQINSRAGWGQIQIYTQVGGIVNSASALIKLDEDATCSVVGNHVDIQLYRIDIANYYVPRGMRL
jgi:hypothetical protein